MSDRSVCEETNSVLHCNKEIIDITKRIFVRFRLAIVLQTHAKHIEENTNHDEDIEFLIGC